MPSVQTPTDTHTHTSPPPSPSPSLTTHPHTRRRGQENHPTREDTDAQQTSKEQTQHRQPHHETVSGRRFLAAWGVLTNLHARQMRKASGAVGPKAATNNHLAGHACRFCADGHCDTRSHQTLCRNCGHEANELKPLCRRPSHESTVAPCGSSAKDTLAAARYFTSVPLRSNAGTRKWRHWRTAKGRGSAKAPLRCGRGSAQGLGSLRSGCKAGEEDSVEDKEEVHVPVYTPPSIARREYFLASEMTSLE